MHGHIYMQGYAPSTHRVLLGEARGGADIGTDAALIDSVLTGYSAGWCVLTGYRLFGSVRVAHGVRACGCACSVLGPANTNACLAGSAKITDVTACPAAAAALGKTYGGSVSQAQRPSGCYLDTGDGTVYFNPSAPGAAAAGAQPVCRVTGAPFEPPPPAHLRGRRGRSTWWSAVEVPTVA
jgi:hypothetical protein